MNLDEGESNERKSKMKIKRVVEWACLLCLMSSVLYGCTDLGEDSTRLPAPSIFEPSRETVSPKKQKEKTRTLSQSEYQMIDADEKRMEAIMNRSGYKTYCTAFLNEVGTIDIVMTSGSFKDSVSNKAIDDYIGAAVATVGSITSQATWESRKLIIKVEIGKWHEITTADCRVTVELFNNARGVIEYLKVSDYMFNHLRVIEK